MAKEIRPWVSELGLDQYAELFAAQAIDDDVLLDLTEADLEKLGLPLGHRKKLLKAIGSRSEADEASVTAGLRGRAERRQLTVMFINLVGSTALMGTLIKGLGHDHVVWGTDAIWTGSPQWQIEALRRLEIPEDMQRQHGFKPLGPADGPVKEAIFGRNSAAMYKYEIKKAGLKTDRFAAIKADYEREGPARSNLRYGYVAKG